MKKLNSKPGENADNKKGGGMGTAFTFANFFPPPIAELLRSDEWAANGLYPTVGLLKFIADPYSGPLGMPVYPIPGVCKIVIGKTEGCGTLIHSNATPQPGSPNYQVVLTAGHVIANVPPAQIEVKFPTSNGTFYTITPHDAFAYNDSNQGLDFGILVVQGVQAANNVISPATITDYHTLSNASKATISGYAAGSYAVTSNTNNMLAQQHNPDLIPTNIQVYCGMSGSPVYVMRGNSAYVVGVTFGTSITNSCNGMAVATLLDTNVCNQIIKWLNQPAYSSITNLFGPQP